jgi:small subunit ribosomal protein S8
MVSKDDVEVPYSKLVMTICDILKSEGYIEDYKQLEVSGIKKVKVYLKYNDRKSAIECIKRVSKPGLRIYLSSKDVKSVLRGHGIGLYSTSKGIFTDRQARENGVGGEYIGMVW